MCTSFIHLLISIAITISKSFDVHVLGSNNGARKAIGYDMVKLLEQAEVTDRIDSSSWRIIFMKIYKHGTGSLLKHFVYK